MLFKIKDVYTNDFVFNYLRNVMVRRFRYLNSKGLFTKMDKYLKSLNSNLSTLNVLEHSLKLVHMTLRRECYLYDFNLSFEYNGYLLKDLINLIEYGNLQVKGTYALSKTFNHILKYINTYFELYKERR